LSVHRLGIDGNAVESIFHVAALPMFTISRRIVARRRSTDPKLNYGDTLPFTPIPVVLGPCCWKRVDPLARTKRSAKPLLKFGERVLVHQVSSDGLTPSERGDPFRVRWQIQELGESLHAFQSRSNSHQAIVLAPEMRGRAGPRPIGRRCSEPRLDGTQSHGPERCQHVRFIHCHAAEPPLKHMPCDPQSRVDVSAESTMCFADGA
jgi:hypothetical protein